MEERKIAYLFSRFPSIWQTYLSREVAELVDRSIPILIISLKNKKWKHIQSEATKLEERVKILRCPYTSLGKIVVSNFMFFFRSPLKYLGILIEIIRFSIGGKMLSLLKNILIFPESVYFARQIVVEDVKHLHATHATYPTLTSFVISRLTGIPYSFAGHASDIHADTTMLGKKIEETKFIVTCAADNVDYLKKNFPESKLKPIYVNYHGISLKRFEYIEDRATNPIRILSVGRIEESKGYDDLVKACYILKNGIRTKVKGVESFKLKIVGDGPLMGKLKEIVQELGLQDYVILPGAIRYDDVIREYKKATIFALPAIAKYHYGIPNVLLEAMASGVPVITTPLAAVRSELIKDGVNGILVEEHSPELIVKAIDSILNDETKRRAMIRFARKKVEDQFDLKRNIDQLQQIFQENI